MDFLFLQAADYLGGVDTAEQDGRGGHLVAEGKIERLAGSHCR